MGMEEGESEIGGGVLSLSVLTSLLREMLQAAGSESGLPAHFCSGLLHADSLTGEDGVFEEFAKEGVPLHPLCRQLAACLQSWAATGVFPRCLSSFVGLEEDESWKARVDHWTHKVLELSSSLLQVLHRAKFHVHVQEPYYSFLKDGSKTVEGRCNTGFYASIKAGDYMLINQSLLLEVRAVSLFPTFKKMLEEEGLSRVLPATESVAEGVQVYRKFYSEAVEEEHGVVAIHVSGSAVAKQPSEMVQMLVSELNVEGTRALLGLRKTTGSLLEVLPPSRSTLLSSFSACQRAFPKEGKSRLTVGARALAKHAHRSSSGWWGACGGTEMVKNELAMKMVCFIIDHATWINIHHLPPAFPAFEIRVKEGYGARWSADGLEFRGFVEPPMEGGHEKKWRH